MARGKVKPAPPIDENSHPPAGSIGDFWTLVTGMTAFVPDDPTHLPPDCPPEEFGFYTFEPGAIELLPETSTEEKA